MNFVSTNDLTNILGVSPQRIASISKQLEIPSDQFEIRGRSKFYSPEAVSKILSHRGLDYSVNRTMAFCNNKGGVGKSTLATNTAMRLASLGFKVLLIDADPQSNASSYLLQDYDYENTLYDVIAKDLPMQKAIVKLGEFLHMIPSSLAMSQADKKIKDGINAKTYFSRMLEKLDYSFVIWDLSPSLGTLNLYALLSCTDINIVTALTDFSVQGLEMTNDLIEFGKEEHPSWNPKVKTVINMFDSRVTSALELLGDISKTNVEKYQTVIRIDNNFNKSQASKSALPTNSNASKDINSFVDEITGIAHLSTNTQIQ